MSPERWQQISRLFGETLEREPQQRAAFLAEACAGDTALLDEVESLLAARDDAGYFALRGQIVSSVVGLRSLKVFLCHSSGDKPAVRDLYGRLKAGGFKPWLDEEDLLPGQDWHVEITKAVKSADVVVVCLSKGSVTKEGYVQREIKLALDVADEKPEGTIFIIPTKLEECPIPDRLSRWHWVNMFEAKGYRRLLDALYARANGLGINIDVVQKIDKNLQKTDWKFFEGMWEHESTMSTYYARTVNGTLYMAYCYGGINSGLDAHYYNCQLEGGTLLARFQWFNRPYSGYIFLRTQSENRLTGGWWYFEDMPDERIYDYHLMAKSIPGMSPLVLIRNTEAERFPRWAEAYFKQLSMGTK
jgi:hypothetical protein